MNESEEHFRVTMFFPLRDNDGNAFNLDGLTAEEKKFYRASAEKISGEHELAGI